MRRKARSQFLEKVMSSAAFVDHAKQMARYLEERELRSSDDLDLARARLQQKYGVGASIFYALRHRPPKKIAADIYARLCQAVEDCAEQQIKALEHDINTARHCRKAISPSVLRQAEILAEELRSVAKQEPGGGE